MAGSLTIRGASIVRSAGVHVGDVVVVDGIIREVAPSARSVAGEVVDGRGLVLMPGVIDPQVHFRDPGLTHKEDLATGSRAAAAGGVTAFLEMPNTKPNTSTLEALDAKLAIGAEKCVVHYGFFIGATGHNDDVLDAADKACGIKIFMGASTGDLLVTDPDVLDRIFRTANKLIAVHAEDERRLIERKASLPADHPRDHPVLRDATAALMATKQAVGLSLKYGTRLHVLHVSSEEEADFLTTVPRDRITAEVCPHHFVLDYEDYERLGTRAQCNPPVRGGRHATALWKHLVAGTFDCTATDHAPHTLEEKGKPYPGSPSGMPGVEWLLPLMADRVARGMCTWPDLARWMCEGPARCYGIVGKGKIEPGYDGDLVLVDPRATRTIRDGEVWTKCGWSPFDGWTTTGWPVMTVIDGQPVFRDGGIVDGVRGRALTYQR